MPLDTPGGTHADVSPANLIDQPSADTLVARAVTIGRTRGELYAFWRDFSNLARIMDDIERIDVIDETRSHWVVKGPGGKDVEWDSLVTEDVPDRRIAWRADEGVEIANSGWVEFRDAPTGRGTQVHALIVRPWVEVSWCRSRASHVLSRSIILGSLRPIDRWR